MQLSKFPDDALRVLIYLASRPDAETLATVEEIAARDGISKEHLRKAVHHLAQSGDLESRRGRVGGLRPACAPAEIRVGSVVRDCAESLALVECSKPGASQCRNAGVRRLARTPAPSPSERRHLRQHRRLNAPILQFGFRPSF